MLSITTQAGSVNDKVLGQTAFDVGAHQSNLEFKEGHLARVVCVQPVEHLLEEHVFLVFRQRLPKGVDKRLAHGLAFVEV